MNKKAILDGGCFINAYLMTTNAHLFDDNKETLIDTLSDNIVSYVQSNVAKLGTKIDEVILAVDSPSWRKKQFSNYKSNRVDKPLPNGMNKDLFLYLLKNISNCIIKKSPPFKVVKVKNAEADDIIFVLSNCNDFIIGVDKDLKQCNYDYFFNVSEQLLLKKEPYDVIEHVLRGDSGDGIPSVLCSDNHYINKEMRKILSARRFDAVKEFVLTNNSVNIALDKKFPINITELQDNISRNSKLIDMSNIPTDIVGDIKQCYEEIGEIPYKPMSKEMAGINSLLAGLDL